MLKNLHIKNLALIREIDIDFTEGLNILTGETGAGKSIIIDSITLALGGKTPRNLLREDAPYGLVELVFLVNDPETIEALRPVDVEPEDEGYVLIARKVTGTRSTCRINGETRTAADVRRAASLLLDIHGQSEHQKLLREEHQLALLDEYGGSEIADLKADVAEKYRAWSDVRKRLGGEDLSEEERNRQIAFLEFETREIEDADLKPGEDARLEKEYRKMQNARKIVVAVGRAHELTGYDSESGAGESVGLAVRELESAASYDEDVSELLGMLTEIESLLGDFNRSAADYLDGLTFADEVFAETEERLDLINHLKSKYGRTVDDILEALKEKQDLLAELKNYEENRKKLKSLLGLREKELEADSQKLTEARKKYAESFALDVAAQLKDLNFARADFAVSFGETKSYTAGGQDTVSFMIATNPGESRRELNKVVSGGELSRIMLGIKTMFASEDRTGTLIFDEVDTGISGRTAQKVAEKMAVIAMNRQVLCITHLPQIAAMADTHYGITKEVTDGAAVTRIESLGPEESVDELARLLGGAEITQNTQKTATEMKEMCRQYKENALKC